MIFIKCHLNLKRCNFIDTKFETFFGGLKLPQTLKSIVGGSGVATPWILGQEEDSKDPLPWQWPSLYVNTG